MIKIGLTGGIGSGKTTVSRVLELLDVPVYSADERGRWISDHDPAVIRQTKTVFGDQAYAADGTMNREYIAEKVFSDRELLQRLNGIVHPAIRRDYRLWLESHPEAPYTVMESAILFESGFDREVDRVVVVTAPEEVRLARTMHRDGADEKAVRARIAAQMDESQRVQKADFVLNANETELLIPQIMELHQKINLLASEKKTWK